MHVTFNVCDLLLYESKLEEMNPRLDSSQVGGNDEDINQGQAPVKKGVHSRPLSPFKG